MVVAQLGKKGAVVIRLFMLIVLASKASFAIADETWPKAGDNVLAQFRPNDWRAANVAKAGADGTFLVRFDEKTALHLPPCLVAIDQAPAAKNIKLGTRVVALFTDGKFYSGTVWGLTNKKYEVQFDDGDELAVAAADLRRVGRRTIEGRAAKVGDRVLAQWRPNVWLPGKVEIMSLIGFHVAFDYKPKSDLPPPHMTIDREPKADETKKFARVLAKRDDGFYPGIVLEIKDNGKLAVAFDDGKSGEVEVKDSRLMNQ